MHQQREARCFQTQQAQEIQERAIKLYYANVSIGVCKTSERTKMLRS